MASDVGENCYKLHGAGMSLSANIVEFNATICFNPTPPSTRPEYFSKLVPSVHTVLLQTTTYLIARASKSKIVQARLSLYPALLPRLKATSTQRTIPSFAKVFAVMSQRFPPIPLVDPSSLGSTFETEVRKHHGDNPGFKYKDQNGAPIGPFAVLRYVSQSSHSTNIQKVESH